MAAKSSNGQMSARQWIAVAGTTLGAFMAVLDIQITNSSPNEIRSGTSPLRWKRRQAQLKAAD